MHSDRKILLPALAIAMASLCPASVAAREPETRTDPATLKATGEPRNCISSRNNVSTMPVAPNVLMFRSGASNWARNDLRGPCTAMRADRVMVFRNASSQYCALDTFSVVDAVSRIDYGICVLGPFTPVEVPKGTRF